MFNLTTKAKSAKIDEEVKYWEIRNEKLDQKLKEVERLLERAKLSGVELVQVKTFDRTKPSLHNKLAEVWEMDEVKWFLEDVERGALSRALSDPANTEKNFGMLVGIRTVISELSKSALIAKQLEGGNEKV